ncbi:uncharacterized protein LOC129591506 [Paramacrobiotus metropolitanus]|uniref:uncharacterized protein LOC129591506 n=1 Tax=Paramacrobiotus metropolitanus TaxID=2943436 RepID=UPI0024464FE5|nr:uncharacterized protein LOC129591506 [Paramacrobiotus metropolitanus]
MEVQRFKVERYQLDRVIEKPDQEQHTESSDAKIILTESDGKEDELLRKLTLPEMVGNSNPPGWASVISSAKEGDLQQRVVLENKHKVFQLLIEEIAPQTKNIIRHYEVKPENPTTDLRIFTENEGAYTILSDMLVTRQFKTVLIPDFTGQILNGLTVLNQYGIVHKDIRCSNILVDKITNIVKIAHFEKASYHRWDSNLGTSIQYPEGSSRFASKEMQQLLAFDTISGPAAVGPATDVFSLGCAVIEMYTRKPPEWVYEENGKRKEYSFAQSETTEVDFVRHMHALWKRQAMPDDSRIVDAKQPEMAVKARAFVALCFGPARGRSCESLKFHSFLNPTL